MGIEQNLIPELVAALNNKPLPSQSWRGLWRRGASDQLNAKSANQSLDALSISCLMREPGALELTRDLFEVEHKAWMGDEQDSTVYGEMHLIAVCGIARAASRGISEFSRGVYADALLWISFWHGLGEICRDPISGNMLTVGDRSGDRDPAGNQIIRGWIRALSCGEDTRVWEGRAKQAKLGFGQSWIKDGCLAVKDLLQEAWNNRALEGWRLLDPVHVLAWEADGPNQGSRVVYKAKSNNPNTPGLLCAAVIYTSGGEAEYSYLPPGGGARVRSEGDQAVCELADGSLRYRSATLGDHEIVLPAGEYAETVVGQG